jgi:hypothetical protein
VTALGRSFFRVESLRSIPAPTVLARLGDRDGALPPSLAADAAVGAVAEAGKGTGRVGDLGWGLLELLGDEGAEVFTCEETEVELVLGGCFEAVTGAARLVGWLVLTTGCRGFASARGP